MQPNPTPTRHRNPKRGLYCASYNTCLGVSCRNGWESFSCGECPLYSMQEKPRADSFMQQKSAPDYHQH